jgi:hypothetical protein
LEDNHVIIDGTLDENGRPIRLLRLDKGRQHYATEQTHLPNEPLNASATPSRQSPTPQSAANKICPEEKNGIKPTFEK